VPSEESLWCHHERGPKFPAEHAARRCEERPVPVSELGPADRPSEHHQLVMKDGVLELELRHASTSSEQSDEADEHEVGQGSQGAMDATRPMHQPWNRILEPYRLSKKEIIRCLKRYAAQQVDRRLRGR
jgi:hypothetical protein